MCAKASSKIGASLKLPKDLHRSGDLGVKPIWLGFIKRKGTFDIELTSMTGLELSLFREGMLAVLDAAAEVVAWLDEHADAEYDDDTPMIPLRSLKGAPRT